jgi:hypothetical protein
MNKQRPISDRIVFQPPGIVKVAIAKRYAGSLLEDRMLSGVNRLKRVESNWRLEGTA